jgi:hypothetical protein
MRDSAKAAHRPATKEQYHTIDEWLSWTTESDRHRILWPVAGESYQLKRDETDLAMDNSEPVQANSQFTRRTCHNTGTAKNNRADRIKNWQKKGHKQHRSLLKCEQLQGRVWQMLCSSEQNRPCRLEYRSQQHSNFRCWHDCG